MKKDKDKWIADVFDSIKGSQRAKPDPGLFAKIENQIHLPEARIVPIFQRRIAAAAAILILILNVIAMQQYAQINALDNEEFVTTGASDQQLISSYKLYE
ncbi:MAG: hypothetical protein DHS20C18_31820 [Saprospiraceae bacterium]|nr:MAG: hypothetical protein DHS20C18_31820 [Saprospiraceae bacterium]